MTSTPPGSTATPPRAPWRFERRERGRMVAGVASGMADAFHIDVVVIRVLWVIAALAGGIGVAAYAICWLAFPSDHNPAPISQLTFHDRESRWRNAGVIAAVVLIALGLTSMFGSLFPPFRHGGELAWASILILGGLAVLFFRPTDNDDLPLAPGPDTPPPAADAAPPPTDTPTTDTPVTGDESPLPPTPPAPPIPPQPPTTSAWTQHAPWPAPPPRLPRLTRPKRPRRRPFLTPLTLSVLLIGGGIVALLNDADVTHITAAQALAGAVCLIGVVLLVSTRFGHARGLIPVGILLLLVTIPASVIDVPITNGIGERTYRPTTVDQVRDSYKLGIGELNIDLRNLVLTDQTVEVDAQLGIGRLDIQVPRTTRVEVRAHAGAGVLTLFGNTFDDDRPIDETFNAPGIGPAVIVIDAKAGAGNLRVTRYDPNGSEVPVERSAP